MEKMLCALWIWFKPSSEIFLLAVPKRCFFSGSFMLILSCFWYDFGRVCLLMPCGHLLGKGWHLGYRLCCLIVVTFPVVSWVRYGAWLYRFLIFAAPFLTFIISAPDSRPRKLAKNFCCSHMQHMLSSYGMNPSFDILRMTATYKNY